ncbi:MAG: histidinol-phosphate transaminase [Chromatiales bacterium]|jgi:histidinol-phosphate aminotransferase
MSNANRFLQISAPGIASLTPYVPGKPVAELERELGIKNSIKLASNENPLGPCKAAKAVIHGQLEQLARYPDGGGFELRGLLAEKHAIDSKRITLGNGSNDVLDMIARVFLSPGAEAVFSQYAFAVYAISTQAVGATARIAKADEYGHDLQAIAALVNDKTRVVFIANPNNPTGTWLRAGPLKAFIASLPEHVVVVVDEAYVEYVQHDDYPDASLWLDEFPNLIVTRTFSKAYGLAGLRVGYALSHAEVADLLNRVRQPFNVNSLALAAAAAALQDQQHIAAAVQLNTQGMHQYEQAFDSMGLSWIASAGNFITVDLQRPAGEIDQLLLREGVITRPVANYGMPNHLRISIGTQAENQRCIQALEKVLA